MSPRRIIFIAVAIIASVLTVVIGRSWLAAQRNAALEAQKQRPADITTQILVAKTRIAVGQFVRPENLRWQPWPKDNMSPNYIVSGKRTPEEFAGAVARSPMSEGEPVTEALLVRPGERGFLAAALQPGERAMTVAISPTSGVGGFIFPGDHVDLLATHRVTGGFGTNEATETFLRDIRVLAIDQRADDEKKDAVVGKTATLAVTPKQAEIINVAQDVSRISLVLRSLARDEAEAVAEAASPEKRSYTFDSEALQLVPPPLVRATIVVRGAAVGF